MHHTPTPFIPAPANSGSPNLPAIIDQLPADNTLSPQAQFTHQRQAAFLRLLADSGEVRVASKAASVSHQTVYRLRRACPTFRLGWDAALIIARERAEEALATRAMHGVEEQVFYHGEVVATRRRYDSRLLLAHLARLDRMAEREDVAHLAGAFDAVVEAFEQCGEGYEPELPQAPEPADAPAAKGEPEATPETSPRPCNMRSMSPDWEGDEVADGDADEATGEEGELPELERRLQAMEAARPADAPSIYESADPWELEYRQLAAFEAGVERWWETALPPEGDREADEQPLPRLGGQAYRDASC
ncbi:MAG: hypothetical protein ACX930_03385 [Erythrobacter sp.]